jgi:leader peptidase (prepilin peptidase) / N-methyltransferase
MEAAMFELIFVFFFGAIVGSFLNVVIHRLPLEESIVFPASHCPRCKKPIAWYDNIPLLSYIILKARCRHCREPISLRYFLVELLTAVFFAVFYRMYGLGIEFFMLCTFTCGLIAATFIDIQHRIIPDEISIGGIVVGVLFNLCRAVSLKPFSFHPWPLVDSLIGIVAGGGIIWLTGYLFDIVYFKLLKRPPIQGETESMGGGDVKLLAMIGAFLGWHYALLTFFIAPFFGAVVGLVNMLVKKDHTIPYGPFLSMAALLCVFWGNQIITALLLR